MYLDEAPTMTPVRQRVRSTSEMPADVSSGLPRASREKLDERAGLAQEFWEVTQPEMVPFVSDEANWYDFDYLEDAQLFRILDDHYGITLDGEMLKLPFWALLDYLSLNRRR